MIWPQYRHVSDQRIQTFRFAIGFLDFFFRNTNMASASRRRPLDLRPAGVDHVHSLRRFCRDRMAVCGKTGLPGIAPPALGCGNSGEPFLQKGGCPKGSVLVFYTFALGGRSLNSGSVRTALEKPSASSAAKTSEPFARLSHLFRHGPAA